MNPSEPKQIENDSRHPVVEPLPNGNESPRRTCDVLSRTFVWVADGSTLEEIGLQAGCTRQTVKHLVADFRYTLGWE